MRVRTLVLYLISNRQAILDLAADRRALWVGLLFVLSAGFAREYDGADLLRQPWLLLVPLAVSLAASFLLFLVACGPVFLRRVSRPRFLPAYRSFLALFWMTAPLAWLYAVPYERFLSPADATAANLWTLGIVAAWRVVLMIRVVAVITARTGWAAFLLVGMLAGGVAVGVSTLVPPARVVGFMGGAYVPEVTENERAVTRTVDPGRDPPPPGETHLTPSELEVRQAASAVWWASFCTAPLWLIGGVVAFFTGRPAWRVPAAPPDPAPPARGMWVLAVLSVLVWLPVLPFTQGEQASRPRVERPAK